MLDVTGGVESKKPIAPTKRKEKKRQEKERKGKEWKGKEREGKEREGREGKGRGVPYLSINAVPYLRWRPLFLVQA